MEVGVGRGTYHYLRKRGEGEVNNSIIILIIILIITAIIMNSNIDIRRKHTKGKTIF